MGRDSYMSLDGSGPFGCGAFLAQGVSIVTSSGSRRTFDRWAEVMCYLAPERHLGVHTFVLEADDLVEVRARIPGRPELKPWNVYICTDGGREVRGLDVNPYVIVGLEPEEVLKHFFSLKYRVIAALNGARGPSRGRLPVDRTVSKLPVPLLRKYSVWARVWDRQPPGSFPFTVATRSRGRPKAGTGVRSSGCAPRPGRRVVASSTETAPRVSGVLGMRPSHQHGAAAPPDVMTPNRGGEVEALFRGLQHVRLVGSVSEFAATLEEFGRSGLFERVRSALEQLDSCAGAISRSESVGIRSHFDGSSPVVPRSGLSYTDETTMATMGHSPWFEREVDGRCVLFLHRLEVWRQANDSLGIWFADDVPATGQILVRGLRHATSGEYHIDWNE